MVSTVASNQRLKQQLVSNDIEAESFAIIAESVDLQYLSRPEREVAARIIHACADPSILPTLVFAPGVISAAVIALKQKHRIITDVEMVKNAIYTSDAICYLSEISQRSEGKTRTQLGIEKAALEFGQGAIFVIGCAPTALFSILDLHERGLISPTAVIALPVGFVGSSQAKEALSCSTIPHITNRGVRGGSAMTAAAFNAIARMAVDHYPFEEASQ